MSAPSQAMVGYTVKMDITIVNSILIAKKSHTQVNNKNIPYFQTLRFYQVKLHFANI